MMNIEALKTQDTIKVLNVCQKTLQDWSKIGKIECSYTSGGHRRYNLKKYLELNNLTHLLPTKESKNVIYCRVSSHDRKSDLERQIQSLKNLYPEYEVIQDIGSGINFNRKGLQKLINYAIEGTLNEVVVSYKDRLCRIGYDLLEFIIKKYSNGKITILHSESESKNEEITKDLIEIITVYSSKLHGKRRNVNNE